MTFNQPIPHTVRNDLSNAARALFSIADVAASQMHHPDENDLANALGAIRLVELAAAQARRATVNQMRANGDTWEAIGYVLGTSKQAVQQRFGTVEDLEQ